MRTPSASGPRIRSPQRLYLLASYTWCVGAHVRVYIVFLCCVCSFARIVLVSGVRSGCVRGVGGEKEKEEEKEKKSVCSWVVVQSKAAMVCLGWNNAEKVRKTKNNYIKFVSMCTRSGLPKKAFRISSSTRPSASHSELRVVLGLRSRFVPIQETDQIAIGRTS